MQTAVQGRDEEGERGKNGEEGGICCVRRCGEGEKKQEKANRRRRASELSDVFLAFLPLLPSSPIHLLFPTAGAKEEGEKGTKRRRQNRNYPCSHASPLLCNSLSRPFSNFHNARLLPQLHPLPPSLSFRPPCVRTTVLPSTTAPQRGRRMLRSFVLL